MKFKFHSIHKAEGKRILRLYDYEMNVIDVTVDVPDTHTFDIGPWLVLYSYGDDSLPKSIRRRIFGKQKRQAAAINQDTGEIGFAAYFTDDDDIASILIYPWQPDHFPGPTRYRIPTAYLPKLDELRGLKRPYKTWLGADELQWFIDQTIGYDALVDGLMFAFRFKDTTIEVGSEFYREVSDWLDVVEPDEDDDYGPLHFCSTTDYCQGGRNDCGDWGRVTCEDCLKSRPPKLTGTTWKDIAGPGSWWTGGR